MNDPSLYHQRQRPRRLIHELPASERPLPRLKAVGVTAMSSAELLALGLGTPDALDMAADILQLSGEACHFPRLTAVELQQVEGVGEALAARIVAMLEFSRRVIFARQEERVTIKSPADAANLLMADMMYLQQEHLRVILLDTRNHVIAAPTIYVGSLNASVVRIGELFRPAITHAAAAIIVAHNHPSGDPEPSPEDIRVTRQIVAAGKQLDIECLDHMIIGHHRFVSLKERGLGFGDGWQS
jgi:DNA repair protein RadC